MTDEEPCAKPAEYQYVWVNESGLNQISLPYCEDHIHDAQPSESILVLPTYAEFTCEWVTQTFSRSRPKLRSVRQDEGDDYFHI